VLLVPPIADTLGQRWPTPVGVLFALASIGVLLGVDALDKRRRRRPVAAGRAALTRATGSPTTPEGG
jgi:hypothetical protein